MAARGGVSACPGGGSRASRTPTASPCPSLAPGQRFPGSAALGVESGQDFVMLAGLRGAPAESQRPEHGFWALVLNCVKTLGALKWGKRKVYM